MDDSHVAPNHGWRHRFKTLARRHQLDPAAADAIQGHAPRTEGERSGDRGIERQREIEKLPRYHFTPLAWFIIAVRVCNWLQALAKALITARAALIRRVYRTTFCNTAP